MISVCVALKVFFFFSATLACQGKKYNQPIILKRETFHFILVEAVHWTKTLHEVSVPILLTSQFVLQLPSAYRHLAAFVGSENRHNVFLNAHLFRVCKH